MAVTRKLRMGMVGGGSGAFIGAVHRRSATLDGDVELVAGAFSSDRHKGLASGRSMFVPDERNYAGWEEMAEREAALPPDERIDFVSIVTPNALHYPIARKFCEAGINVVCEKPMTLNATEAIQLGEVVRKSGVIFALAHTYTGYPMVKQAREFARSGVLGRIGRVTVNYSHGNMLGVTGAALAARWRTDPALSGISNSVADIGTHCENLIRYVTGLSIDRLCADLHRAPGNVLDNEAAILIDFLGGAKGVIQTSQLCAGDQNNLTLRVHGDKASLEWVQVSPEQLWLRPQGEPSRLYRRGDKGLCSAAQKATRLPPGHPEGFIEALANVYANVCDAIRARLAGEPEDVERDYPGISDGEIGMKFVETVVAADAGTAKWVIFPTSADPS